jgi:hypothetical protein
MEMQYKGLKKVAESVKPDSKKRILLSGIKIEEGVRYHIYRNKEGQILLDPQVSIPAREAWLFKNHKALDSVKRGLLDAEYGRISEIDINEL